MERQMTMFDFGALKDTVVDAIGSSGQASDMLSNLSLDPSILEGLQLDQIGETLAQSGIDLQSLSELQVTDLITQVTENGGLEGLDLSQILGDGLPGP